MCLLLLLLVNTKGGRRSLPPSLLSWLEVFLLLFQPTISLATGYGVFVPSRSYDSTDYGIPQSVIEAWLSGGVVIEPVDASHLEQRISTNESNISSLQSDVSGLQSDLNAVEGRVSTNESNISSLQSELNAIDGRVSTNESNIQELDDRVSALEGGGS